MDGHVPWEMKSSETVLLFHRDWSTMLFSFILSIYGKRINSLDSTYFIQLGAEEVSPIEREINIYQSQSSHHSPRASGGWCAVDKSVVNSESSFNRHPSTACLHTGMVVLPNQIVSNLTDAHNTINKRKFPWKTLQLIVSPSISFIRLWMLVDIIIPIIIIMPWIIPLVCWPLKATTATTTTTTIPHHLFIIIFIHSTQVLCSGLLCSPNCIITL